MKIRVLTNYVLLLAVGVNSIFLGFETASAKNDKDRDQTKDAGSMPSTPPNTPQPTTNCTPDEIESERKQIRDVLNKIEVDLQKSLPGLGSGWGGNVTGNGPKCNVVSDAFWSLWGKYGSGIEKNLKCLKVGPAFDPGWLPLDLAAHVAIGIYLRDCKSGVAPIRVIDPWRTGDCSAQKPEECHGNFRGL